MDLDSVAMESAHLLGPGAKKRVKIHPHTVTPGVHTHFPQPGDEGYDDAPSFEDFGSFLDETSDRTKLTEARKWPQTLFAGEGSSSSVGVKGPGKGVGGQLASFGEASVSASRWTWALLLGAALAHGALVFLTRLASERFGLSPLLLVLVRSAAQLLSVAAPLQRGENPFGPPGYRLRLLCYGLTYSLSLCCASASLAFAATEYATPTGRLATSALSAALAFLLLEERLGLADGVALVTGICGLGLTLLPAADQPEAPGGGATSADPVAFWRAAFGWSLSAMAGLWMALALVSYPAACRFCCSSAQSLPPSPHTPRHHYSLFFSSPTSHNHTLPLPVGSSVWTCSVWDDEGVHNRLRKYRCENDLFCNRTSLLGEVAILCCVCSGDLSDVTLNLSIVN
uniref:EamA domain-containing protein n=1 Tax=Gadus morhua TaxID=8049 RepID=A0A8C5CU75_GADMO